MAGMSTDLNIAIQIRAQITQAEASLKSIQAQISELGATSASASAATTESATAMTASMTAGAASMKAMQATVAESEAAAAARIHDMVQASLASGAATARVAKSERALWEERTNYQGASEAQLAATAELSAAQDASAGLTEKSVLVQGAEALAQDEAAGATTAHAAAEAGLNTVMMSGNATREYGALLDELLRRRYSQMVGTTAVLTNRMGLLRLVFSGWGASIIGVAAALGILGYAVYRGEKQASEFSGAVIAAGGALGVTRGDLYSMADAMTNSRTTIGSAREALLEVAQTGQFAGNQLRLVAQGALNLADVTGVSIKQAISDFQKLAAAPVRAVVALNNKYHFLTLATYDQIKALTEQGKKDEAAALAEKTLGDAMQARAQKMQAQGGIIMRVLHSEAFGWSALWNKIMDIGAPQTAAQQLAAVRKEIAQTEAALVNVSKGGTLGSALAPAAYDVNALRAHLTALMAQADALDSQITARHQQATAEEAAAKKIDDELNTQTSRSPSHKVKQMSSLEIDKHGLARLEAADKVSEKERGAFELKYWQQKLAEAQTGSQEYAQIYATVAHLQTEQARVAAEAQRKAAEQARQLAEIQISSARSAGLAEIQLEKQTLDQLHALGEISGEQEIAAERTLENKKYQIELAAEQRKLALEKGNLVATANTQEQIQALSQQHALAMAQLDNQMVIDARDKWRSILSPIAQAFEESIRGVIRGTLTVKNAMRDLAQSMVLEFINAGVKMLTTWIANQLALTGATAAGESARVAIKQAADKQSLMSTALTTTKEILMKVWSVMANVYNSVSSIPFVGWILAPIMAIAAGALVASWAGRVASAAGGWVVPGDQLAMVHEKEMILPRHLSEGLQGMIAGGNSGSGDVHLHVHAIDAGGVRDFFKQNQFELAAALRQAHRNGAFA